MSRPSGNQLVLFSQESRENKTTCFPRDLTLSVYCCVIITVSRSKGSIVFFNLELHVLRQENRAWNRARNDTGSYFQISIFLFWFFSPLKFSPQDNKIDEKNGKNKLLLKSYFVDYATQCTPLHCELLYITRRATNLI